MMTPARKEPDLTTYAGRFAARLRTLRLKAKLTPEQAAEGLGLKSAITIYDWESGKTQPKISILPEIAEILKTNPRNILPKF